MGTSRGTVPRTDQQGAMMSKPSGCIAHYLAQQEDAERPTIAEVAALRVTADQTGGVRGTERVLLPTGTQGRFCKEHAAALRAAARITTSERQTEAALSTNRARYSLPESLSAAKRAMPNLPKCDLPSAAALLRRCEALVWDLLSEDREDWAEYLALRERRESSQTIGWDREDQREDRREDQTARRYALRFLSLLSGYGATAETISEALGEDAEPLLRGALSEALSEDYRAWQDARRPVLASQDGPCGWAMLGEAPPSGLPRALIRFDQR